MLRVENPLQTLTAGHISLGLNCSPSCNMVTFQLIALGISSYLIKMFYSVMLLEIHSSKMW